jgi:hypothetical protein
MYFEMKPTLTSLNCKSKTSIVKTSLEMLACKLNHIYWKKLEAFKMYGLEITNLVKIGLRSCCPYKSSNLFHQMANT